MGKYQIRIRKPLPVDQLPKVFDALAALGGGTAISIILVDTDNSDLFDDDFDWDGV